MSLDVVNLLIDETKTRVQKTATSTKHKHNMHGLLGILRPGGGVPEWLWSNLHRELSNESHLLLVRQRRARAAPLLLCVLRAVSHILPGSGTSESETNCAALQLGVPQMYQLQRLWAA